MRDMIINRLLATLVAILLLFPSLVACETAHLQADFIAERTEVVGISKIQFTDLSQGAIRNWAWDFDSDGIVDSAEQNPVHTYKKDGSYSVTLTVTGSKDRSSITREHYINVTGCGG